MNQQQQQARRFFEYWIAQRGSEKGEDQQFWNSLLRDVFGVREVEKCIKYQVPVHYRDTTRYLDAWLPGTRVLIEHKSRGIDLDAPQEHHEGKTPFQQAWDYDNNRPFRERARWIVVCNFDEFRIHDMEADVPETTFERVLLKELPKEIHRLGFLVQAENAIRAKELEVSVKAGRVVGKLYNSFLEQYGEAANDPEVLKNLNKLCVRLVFCVYAEDAGVFAKDQFLNFLRKNHFSSYHALLRDLFKVLSMTAAERSRDIYLSDELKAFPYVGGGLFREEVPIAPFSERTAKILLDDASEQFDWSEISPTIFGAVFESTLNPETRRKEGMHYTSEENIHKVIDPLFLEQLRGEFEAIRAEPNLRKRNAALIAFQEKLGSFRFLDPACGSGNFLTETYISLRKLENEALALLFKGQGQLDLGDRKLIHVSINQFYGIEINDFAVTVAQTAMWIAECKMMEATSAILSKNLTPLPLTDSAKIVEGNALRMDWEENLRLNERLPEVHYDYIMGNPPFVGASMMSAKQKAEAVEIFGKGKRVNSIDYVGAWYYKAAAIMGGTSTRAAFVSTNSITQGEQVAPFWGKLIDRDNVEIDFAWRTFVWDSEATEKAHVHVVIIGFHTGKDLAAQNAENAKILFGADGSKITAKHINPYLCDAPDAILESVSQPLCAGVKRMTYGNKPSDGGNLILTEDECRKLIGDDPSVKICVRRYIGAKDSINSDVVRYCLWLRNVSPSVYRANFEIRRRLEAVREMRAKSTAAPTRQAAETPYLFFSSPQTEGKYLLVPEVSSERRKYIPMGFFGPEYIAANTVSILPDATLYDFGVLTSSVHMAWMRVVAGRLKSDYRYSAAIVYNNFPWPSFARAAGGKPAAVAAQQRAGRPLSQCGGAATGETPVVPVGTSVAPVNSELISRTAQGILDARALYPDSSLADLYDPLTMPPELRKAHAANDAAVMEAYGFEKDLTEPEIVSRLFGMYAELVKGKNT